MKTIYFQNPCWENFGCILLKEKNVIEIHNNKISKNFGEFYSLDSLKNILKRDYENNGKDPSLSDNPEKLLIQISYDKNKFKNFEQTLNKLIETYEEITKKTNINIWIIEKLEIPKPPPIPIDEENFE